MAHKQRNCCGICEHFRRSTTQVTTTGGCHDPEWSHVEIVHETDLCDNFKLKERIKRRRKAKKERDLYEHF